MRSLSFQNEADSYISRLDQIRTPDEVALIQEYANAMNLGKTQNFAVVAAHIKETDIFQTLCAYNESNLPEDHLIIVFFNCNDSVSQDDYERLLQDRLREIDSAKLHFPSLHLQTFSRRFPQQVALGKVRGLIADALVLAAREQNLRDPIYISNDADALAYQTNYVQNVRQAFDEQEFIDYISGPISWGGFDQNGHIRYSPPVIMPELYFVDWISSVTDGLYRQLGYVFTTGCNSAFRLSALCAIGGYDYVRMPHFDVDIGYALNKYRHELDGAKLPNEYARFVSDCHLAGSPRRTLYAMLSNIPVGQQFESFGTVAGPDLSLRELIDEYIARTDWIQSEDLLNFGAGPSAHKCHSRLARLFTHSIQGEQYRDKSTLAHAVAARTGFCIDNVRLNSMVMTGIDIDWSKSAVMERLIDWHGSALRPERS